VSDELISLLSGVDVVITCLILTDMDAMKNIAIACQKAGVGRFIPSFWGPICPPRGVMKLRTEVSSMILGETTFRRPPLQNIVT
jgi:hypothetical protein